MISLMKDELGGKTMTDFVALRAKMYAYKRQKKKWKKSTAKAQKRVWFLKGLRLMTTRPAYLMWKQYTESKSF